MCVLRLAFLRLSVCLSGRCGWNKEEQVRETVYTRQAISPAIFGYAAALET